MTTSPAGWRVLLTNVWLDRRGGTEAVVRDVAMGLLKRGHRPVVYSPHLGAPATELLSRGVAVIQDLAQMTEAPDLIHGQHFIQTGEALMRFPDVPAIQMCHGWQIWQESPADFPQVHRFIAVDQAVRDRLVHIEGIAPERVEILLNAVDLDRIPARTRSLPSRPQRAVAFTKFRAQIPLIAHVCEKLGIELDVLGAGGDRLTAEPEAELVNYDLVFATARMAMEALCAGCAVVVCDARGMAEMVTADNVARLRPLNFGLRSLVHRVTPNRLEAEIARYDPADAMRVTRAMRKHASLPGMLDRLVAIYAEAMAAPRAGPEAHLRATRQFLHKALPRQRLDGRWPWMAERDTLLQRIRELDRELAEARASAATAR